MLRPRHGGRLHLACGDVHLGAYLNVDLPPEQGVASGTSRPDVEADIWSLSCPPGRLGEIRMHHVFEHFSRAEALALIVRWYDWLAPGGLLTIETPDFERCVDGFAGRTDAEQALILRHVFGSQEAHWAQHLDGWSERRYGLVLPALGFEPREYVVSASDERGLLANVIVHARRAGDMTRDARVAAAHDLLRLSMNGPAVSEQGLLARWTAAFDALVDTASGSAA